MENSDEDCGFHVSYYTSENKALAAMNDAVNAHLNICGTPPVYGEEGFDEDNNCMERSTHGVVIRNGYNQFIWSVDPVIPID
jgi:hypothetical protein